MNLIHIVAMSKNRVIGNQGKIPWHISADLKSFKQRTMGHLLIMGRKTFESIGRPLSGRMSLVVSKKGLAEMENLRVCESLPKAYEVAERLQDKWGTDVYVIGGGEIYSQSLAKVNQIWLTIVERELSGDTFYPEINLDDWVETDLQHFTDPESYSIRLLTRKNLLRESTDN